MSEKLDFKKTKMDCICHCDNCGKKIVFAPFYKNITNTILCKKCFRGLKK